MKEEILRLIDENRSPWVKAAFYSDPEVSKIVESLIARWESRGMSGIPLDHATEEELRILYKKAQEYGTMSDIEAMGSSLEGGKGLLSRFRRLFSK